MLLFLLTLLGVAKSAPVATSTTIATPTASITGIAASATSLPDTSIINSLELTDPATWVELAIIWTGFFIGFLQAYFIYYLLTGAASRRRGRSCFPNTDDSAGQNPQRQSRKGPRRLCFFEWGMTRQDYDAYFWDPEGYGRRRYEEQEKQNLHNILLRYFRRWFALKSHRKRDNAALVAAGSVGTSKARRHRHPCELTSANDPNVLDQPDSDRAASLPEASEEPYQLAQSPFDTTRRRNVTGHRASPWKSYGRASSQEAATTAREWSTNTTDYYDALDSAEVVDRPVFRRACTAPVPVMPPETENATRAASEGACLPKGHCPKVSNLAMSSYSASEYDAEDYEAGASIDLEISSCGSSIATTVWPMIRAGHSRVISNTLPEQLQATSEASRISQVPEFNPSAAYILPKTRCPGDKSFIPCTERTPTEKSS